VRVSIVGAGVSGLFSSYALIKKGIAVDLYEKEAIVGKKLLIAGKSGLNITSDYPKADYPKMYFENSEVFKELLMEFSADDTRAWLRELGFESFVGSSYKVFPKEFKAANLLSKLKKTLLASELFSLKPNSTLVDFDDDFLYFEKEKISYDRAIFALGGATWSDTGSDGKWLSAFERRSIEVIRFSPSNCGFKTKTSTEERIPLKNIAITFKEHTVKGEAMLYNKAIEGGAIYHLSSYIRDEVEQNDYAQVTIDFLPMKNADELIEQLSVNTKNSWANTIRKNIKLEPKLFKIIKKTLSKNEFFNPKVLVETIKNFKLDLSDLNELDKAISSAGGISFNELDRAFRLRKYQKIHICGEMIDWEAPTGGFLIQGCLAIANRVCTELK